MFVATSRAFLLIVTFVLLLSCGSNQSDGSTSGGKPNGAARSAQGGGAGLGIPPLGPSLGGFDGLGSGSGTANNFPRGTARITGTVWAPGNAPGMVPSGHEIPVFNALIELAYEAPPPIPQKTYCEVCSPVTGMYTTSDHKGNFTLENAPAGTFWLSIRKGQFRVDQEITIADGETIALATPATTLPSVNQPDAHQWVPKMAIALGAYDSLQDVMGKMGIGGLMSPDIPIWNPDGEGADAVDVYSNGGQEYPSLRGSFETLVRDRERMLEYHIIFVACSDWLIENAMREPQVLRNIRDYVAAGGKLYVTDWSSFVEDDVFPQQLRFGPATDHDAQPAAYDRAADTWHPEHFAVFPRDEQYSSENAEAVDQDLAQWITGQRGPSAELLGAGIEQTYDPKSMQVVDSYQRIETTQAVTVGVDEQKNPVVDKPHVFVVGGEGNQLPKRPLTVSFQPAGCGRVLYSTYHTSPTPHQGLYIQERILLYLIMEVTVCRDDPVPLPPDVR